MIIPPKRISLPAACIAFFLVAAPGIVRSQEQTAPTGTPPEAAIEEPAAIPISGLEETVETMPTSTSPVSLAAPEEKTDQDRMETAAPTEEGPAPYIVKKGDTLWDIAHALLKDPFLWPFIWKANIAITNPDLIYPGNRLIIPNLGPIERALQTPPEAPQEMAQEPPVETTVQAEEEFMKPEPAAEEETAEAGPQLVLPEELPVPIVDKYAMLSAGFVNGDETDDKIVAAQEKDKSIFGFNDIVYVKLRNQDQVNIGDKFLVYKPLNRIKHPVTGERYGRLVRGLGILEITAKDSPDVLTARISLSFDAIGVNNMLTPYQEPTLIYPSQEKKDKDISGYILEVTDKRTINGQTDFVYLDRGSAAGVEPGDTFAVYDEQKGRGFPRIKIGEVKVILVKERTSTAVVSKSENVLAKGNSINLMK